ncbi:MAG: glutamine amidotransferase-related protein [Alphaproteobacteria bacterium]
MKKTALVLRHLSAIDLGSLAGVLELHEITYEYVDTFKQDIKTYDPLAYDVVIVLGGTCGVYNQNEYPFLKDEIEFIKARIDADRPTLGICLGCQMIAAALGANVYPGKQGVELGWVPLDVNERGQKTPIKYFEESETQCFFSHGDTFDMPEGATLLASTDMYPHQAFTYGNNIMATQFHPEVETSLIEEILILQVSKLSGENTIADIHQIRKDTHTHVATYKAQTEKFLNAWIDMVLVSD